VGIQDYYKPKTLLTRIGDHGHSQDFKLDRDVLLLPFLCTSRNTN